jgi:hypothetical protein
MIPQLQNLWKTITFIEFDKVPQTGTILQNGCFCVIIYSSIRCRPQNARFPYRRHFQRSDYGAGGGSQKASARCEDFAKSLERNSAHSLGAGAEPLGGTRHSGAQCLIATLRNSRTHAVRTGGCPENGLRSGSLVKARP